MQAQAIKFQFYSLIIIVIFYCNYKLLRVTLSQFYVRIHHALLKYDRYEIRV